MGLFAVGYGLPGWLDTTLFLTADETKELGAVACGSEARYCPICQRRFPTDRAHIVRKGMGGTKKEGPTLFICRPCHTGDDGLDRQEEWAVAVRRDLIVCVVRRDGFVRPICKVPVTGA